MNITYRKATENDTKALYDLGVLLNEFNKEHEDPNELFWDGWENDFEMQVKEEISNPLLHIYIAETDDKDPVGYIVAKICDHCKHFLVDQLYVKEEYRRNEVGKKLLDLIIEEGKKVGSAVEVETYKNNTQAIRFYEKYGFRDHGVILKLEF